MRAEFFFQKKGPAMKREKQQKRKAGEVNDRVTVPIARVHEVFVRWGKTGINHGIKQW
jgi:hypothetical protein